MPFLKVLELQFQLTKQKSLRGNSGVKMVGSYSSLASKSLH